MTRRSTATHGGRADDGRGRRQRAAIVAAVLFVSYAYFHSGGGWNQNSRFDLVRAIVEQGTVRIDAYHENTGDKSRHGGHVYSDKAPGASFTAVPAVGVVRWIARAAGANLEDPAMLTGLAYTATLAAGSLPGVFLGLSLFVLARRTGASDGVAAQTALIAGLGTPLWAYATLLWGHLLAASCLAAAMLAVDRLRRPPDPRRDLLRGAAAGAGAGWAVVTEFPAAVPAVLIAAVAVAMAWTTGRARATRVAAGIAMGAAPCVLILGAYQWAAFGSPLHVGYASLEDPTLLDAGFFGITVPRADVLAELLWGSYRGLLPLAPALLAAPFGLWMLWRRRDMRPVAMVAGGSALYYLLLNAAYEHWEGGWSYGPRHLAPAIGLAAIGLAPVLTHAKPFLRSLVLLAGVWGAAHSLVAVSTTTQPPSQQYRAPMRQLLWPAFSAGEFSLNTQSFLDALPRRESGARAAFNLGETMGLTGHASLLPLALLYVVAWRAWRAAAPAVSSSPPDTSRRRPRRAPTR